jgi:glycosyltransferase involved in cell wall biosynthesis
MLARTSRHVDQFVSPSRFTANMHAERGFTQPVEHLPYFIERSDGDWQKPGLRYQDKPYFLFVGRLEIIKGLQTLINIWNRVLEFDLLVAGTGTQAGDLHVQASGNPRIKFLGAQSQRDLGNLYFHAIATIVPSITYETFGIIIVESFARKTPVIVRDLGALPEVVLDSGGGFIYQKDVELLSAIENLASKPDLRKEMGDEGYQAFIQNWSKEAHLRMYYKRLNEIALRKFGHIPWE